MSIAGCTLSVCMEILNEVQSEISILGEIAINSVILVRSLITTVVLTPDPTMGDDHFVPEVFRFLPGHVSDI